MTARKSPGWTRRAGFLAMAAAMAMAARAADWRQFRGPHGNGFADETGLAWNLDAADTLAWQAALPGRGLSSPIIVGDRVFVTCASGPRQQILHVICLNARDGTRLWERRFWATGRTQCHEKTCVAAPTPASDGRLVYALFSSNDLVCLDLDGNLVWLRGLTLDYPNVSNSLGMSSSLAVTDGVVLAQVENDSESCALGLDAATGVNRWRLERPKLANWTSPGVFRDANGRAWFALQSGKGLAGVEPATGRVGWNYPQGASTIPSGAVAGGAIYVPSFGITAIRPEAGQTNLAPVWRAGPLRPGTASPAVAGERLYVLNEAGVLNCGDLASGERLWQLRLKGSFSASPVVAENRLVAVNEKGLLQIVDLAGAEGRVVTEKDLAQTILSTPSIAGGAMYLRSDSTIWKWGRGSPK